MFRKYQHTASVSRLAVSEVNGYKQSGLEPTGKSYQGHLKALSLSELIDQAAFGKDYHFTCDLGCDIRESDRLTIEGSGYDVKGVSGFRGISFNCKKLILTKVSG